MFIRFLGIELKKALFNRVFASIILLLSICFFIDFYFNFLKVINDPWYDKKAMYFSFNYYIGTGPSQFRIIFLLLLPLIVCMPYALSHLNDRKINYQLFLLTRISFWKYYLGKMIAVFCSGILITVYPFILSFIIINILMPIRITNLTNVEGLVVLRSLLPEHPLKYMVIYMVITGLFGGIIAVFTMCTSMLINHKFIAMIFPFLLSLIYGFIVETFGKPNYEPHILADPSQPIVTITWNCIIGVGVVMFIISIIGNYVGMKKHARI
ncbi:hypothetical protein NSQ59_01530 [Margalitia sp. FSL K6-0131]|uniref:hypothetical protein n=1 Tax=Margalitia sp. FSL K6-0131 TaxID=2954604 RepID=UPI0030F5D429